MTEPILDRAPPPADARIRFGANELQCVDLRMPERASPHPCVIAIHGGFWRNAYNFDHLGHLCAALTAHGFATVNVEYRRVGDPGGGWPGTFEDVTAASQYIFDHAADLNIDPGCVIVLGHSAGGHLASWLASMENVPAESSIRAEPQALRGTVALAGVLDLRQGWELGLSNGAVADFLGGGPDEVPVRYAAASPIELMPSAAPHLLVHGSDDDIVPVEMSRAYHTLATRSGGTSTLLTPSGAGHFDVIDPESNAWPKVASAIVSLVAG